MEQFIWVFVGLVVIVKWYNCGALGEALRESGRFLLFFAGLACVLVGALGDTSWLIGLGLIVGGVYGIKWLYDAARFQMAQQAHASPAPSPPRSDWDFED